MSRPSEAQVLMDYARNAARRGTCSRLQVGAVITVDGRLISSGYNGVPSKLEHCTHECECTWPVGDPTFGHDDGCPAGPCKLSVHAEANAIAFAARYGVATHKACMWVTHMPCLDCAKLIINAGLSNVYYAEPYRDESGVRLLQSAGVGVLIV